MNHKEYIKLMKEYGEEIKYCKWCKKWKPISKMYKHGRPHFYGMSICCSCYNNFRNMIKNEDVVKGLIKWIERNTGIKIQIL